MVLKSLIINIWAKSLKIGKSLNIVKKNMESIIKWQTGEPKVKGSYIITTDEGTIALVSFYPDNSSDVEFFRICVTAWCRLSDIEPYKEETK